jgi:hypothetical protein
MGAWSFLGPGEARIFSRWEHLRISAKNPEKQNNTRKIMLFT